MNYADMNIYYGTKCKLFYEAYRMYVYMNDITASHCDIHILILIDINSQPLGFAKDVLPTSN